MEKKYLEVKFEDVVIGAFEDVHNFIEEEDKLTFDCEDGHIECTKDEDDVWMAEIEGVGKIYFTSYKMEGRRTFKRHMGIN